MTDIVNQNFIRSQMPTESQDDQSNLVVVLDTETTGRGPRRHKIVELALLEIEADTGIPTGNYFHCYLNPGMPIDPEASAVHGITDEMLINAPTFKDVLPDVMKFIAGKRVIAHNMPFDAGFMNAEIEAACVVPKGQKPLLPAKNRKLSALCAEVECTLSLSRRVDRNVVGHKLDNVCDRYQVDRSKRTLHGALLDCELLAAVYPMLKQREKQANEDASVGLSFDPVAYGEEINQHMRALAEDETPLPYDSEAVEEMMRRLLELKDRASTLARFAKPLESALKHLSGGVEMRSVNDEAIVKFTLRTTTDWKKVMKNHCPADLDLTPYITHSTAMSVAWLNPDVEEDEGSAATE